MISSSLECRSGCQDIGNLTNSFGLYPLLMAAFGRWNCRPHTAVLWMSLLECACVIGQVLSRSPIELLNECWYGGPRGCLKDICTQLAPDYKLSKDMCGNKTEWLVWYWRCMSLQDPRSYHDGYRLVAVCIHGESIVLPLGKIRQLAPWTNIPFERKVCFL